MEKNEETIAKELEMRERTYMAAALALALAAAPAAAQDAHQHGGEEAEAKPASTMMCHDMMGGEMGEMGEMGMAGHDMMNGQSMMGGSGMMSGGMSMMMQGMAGMPGMRMTLGSGPDAAMILRAADGLGLDEQQTQQLEVLRQRSLEIHESHMGASAQAREEATALLGADVPDLDAYEQALWEGAQHMVTAHLGLVRLSFEARDVLNQDQLELLEASVERCLMMEGSSESSEHRR